MDKEVSHSIAIIYYKLKVENIYIFLLLYYSYFIEKL